MCNYSDEECLGFLKKRMGLEDSLEFLGSGGEGYVWRLNNHKVVKVFHNKNGDRQQDLSWNLQALEENFQNHDISAIPEFEQSIEKGIVILSYEDSNSQEFGEGHLTEEMVLSFLKDFKKIGWVTADLQPKNLRFRSDKIFLCDIGKSLFPFSQELFDSMCRKIFVTYKAQEEWKRAKSFKKDFLTPNNQELNLKVLERLGYDEASLKSEYDEFIKKLGAKQDILIQEIEKEIEAFLRKVPFHSLFFIYDIDASPQHLGGTCSERCIYFKQTLEKRFPNKLNARLHRCKINGQQTHTVILVSLDGQDYIIDVGMGFPLVKAIPCFKPIDFSAYGIRFTSKISGNIIRLFSDMSGEEKLLFELDKRPQAPEQVENEIKNRFADKSIYPFGKGIRYFAIIDDTYIQIKHDNIFEGSPPPSIRRFPSD